MISYLFEDGKVHSDALDAIHRLVHRPDVVRSVTSMAHEEMQTVAEADDKLLMRHSSKLWFYYGTQDAWCPLKYCTEMRKRLPEADITVCDNKIEHAFCLRSSREMAEIVGDKLRKSEVKMWSL